MLIMGLISFIPVFHYEAFHFETWLQFRHITALSSNFQTCVKKNIQGQQNVFLNGKSGEELP